MTIYAGAPFHSALIMGIVMECAKLVSLSWLYRNWKSAGILLRGPIIAIALVIMLVTNIGVFGFLSKSHLEQGAATIDNSAKVEQINQQIAQEQSRIADSEKIIAQMDGAVNSLIGKDQANRSLAVRRSQASQRKQLREEITASQAQISKYNQEKFALESEVRKLQLEVGPIRYIAEVFHSDGDTKSIETAVQIFTLLIVLILDPAAVMLLLAANHSFAKHNVKEKKEEDTESIKESLVEPPLRPKVNSEQTNGELLEEISVAKNQELHRSLPDDATSTTPKTLPEPKINEETNQISPEVEAWFTYIPNTTTAETHNEGCNASDGESASDVVPVHTTGTVQETIPSEEVLVGIINENEEAIMERFGSSTGLLHQSAPASFILQPNITRVDKKAEGSSQPVPEITIPEMETEVQQTVQAEDLENITRRAAKQPWQWSRFTDAPESKKIKTLSWLKEFGKE